MKHCRLVVIYVLTLLLTGCNKTFHVKEHDNERYTVEFDGNIRTFYFKVPEGYSKDKQYSLMFYLHGAGQTAFEVSDDGFTEIAHKSNYLIVYPGAVLGSWKLYDKSDIDYMDELIQYMFKNYSINRDRVFVAGFSLGGFMAIKLAFELPQKISGISVLSGSIFPEHLPKTQPPIAVQHIHALDDSGIPYNGTKDQVLSIPESIEYWMEINKTKSTPTFLHNSDDLSIKRWDSDNTNNSVELITYTYGGHKLLLGSPDFVMDFFNNVEN